MTPYFYNPVKENKCSLSFQTQQPTSETLPEQSLCFPESCQVQQWMWHQAQVLEPAGEQGLTAKSCLHPQHRCLSPGCSRAALTPLCTTLTLLCTALTLCALPWHLCAPPWHSVHCPEPPASLHFHTCDACAVKAQQQAVQSAFAIRICKPLL